MRATIDKAGRVVIPKPLREQVGMGPGEVEISVAGAGLHIAPVSATDVAEEDGHLVIPSAGLRVDDDLVQALRRAGQR